LAFDKDVTAIDKKMAQLIKGAERGVAKKYAALLTKTKALLAKQYADFEKDGQLTLQEMLKNDRLKKMMKELDFLLKPHYKSMDVDIKAALGQTYKTGFENVIAAISKESKRDIGNSTATPETLTAMLKNPVAGLTLNERLERMRVKIIDLIQKQITQGLQKNETYATMAKRLKGELEGDAVKAMRIVRTEGHRVQESAKLDAATHATDNGVVMHKEWNTMEDGVVRRKPKNLADHKKLNGKKIPTDQLFDDGLSKGLAPGQLPAAGSSINCRCFLTYSLERLEKQKAVDVEREKEPVKVKEPDKPKVMAAADIKTHDDAVKWGEKTGVYVSMDKIPIEALRGILERTEKTIKRIPLLKGYLDNIKDTPQGSSRFTGENAHTIRDGISYNPTMWKDGIEGIENRYSNIEHPRGTNALSVVTHELAHSLEEVLSKRLYTTKTGRQDHAKIIRKKVIKDLNLKERDIARGLSRYATTNQSEFFAEAFAEWLDSPSPRPIAMAVGKEIEKLIKEVEGKGAAK
jgi:hypothetical protein